MDRAAYRIDVIERLTEKARTDRRVVAAAAVGSTAVGGDNWSDVDLTFAVAPGATVDQVFADWTREVVAEFGAVELFDVSAGVTIYRVFLFPGVLQVDLSFVPAVDNGAFVGKGLPNIPDEELRHVLDWLLRRRKPNPLQPPPTHVIEPLQR